MSNRISKVDWLMRVAECTALVSEDLHRKVGAVVTTEDYRIISTGYNGLGPGIIATHNFLADRDVRLKFMMHAEQNALSMVKRDDGNMIFVTLLPCCECMKLIVAHGIKSVFYREEYDRDARAHEVAKFYDITLSKVD